MTETKDGSDLGVAAKGVGDIAERTTGELVRQVVGEPRARLAVATFFGEVVAVTPDAKRPAVLDIAETIVPGELSDLGVPGDPNGRERKGTERDRHASASAGDDGLRLRCDGRCGAGWRRCERNLVDAGALPGRHQAGEIARVCEEKEDGLDGKWEPLLSLKRVAHTG